MDGAREVYSGGGLRKLTGKRRGTSISFEYTMPRAEKKGGKSASAAAAAPVRYEEKLNGPTLFLDVQWRSISDVEGRFSPLKTHPPSADASHCCSFGQRWGHRLYLSPSTTHLCIVGGSRSPVSTAAAVKQTDEGPPSGHQDGVTGTGAGGLPVVECLSLPPNAETEVGQRWAWRLPSYAAFNVSHWPTQAPVWVVWPPSTNPPTLNNTSVPAMVMPKSPSLASISGEMRSGDCGSAAVLADAAPSSLFFHGGWAGGTRRSHLITFIRSDDAESSMTSLRPFPVALSHPYLLPHPYHGGSYSSGALVAGSGGGSSSSSPSPMKRRYEEEEAVCWHSATVIRSRVYAFGGETQKGTIGKLRLLPFAAPSRPATRESFLSYGRQRPAGSLQLSDAGVSREMELNPAVIDGVAVAALPPFSGLSPAALQQQQQQQLQSPLTLLPPPPPRASHAACSLCDRYLVIFGGRRLRFVDGDFNDGDAATPRTASSSRKGPKTASGGASPAGRQSRSPAAKRRQQSQAGAGEAAAVQCPIFSLYNDVSVFDVEAQQWLAVVVTGSGGVPSPRYGAAVAAVPSSISSGLQRDIVVIGGLGERGEVLAEAWVLQCVSGSGRRLHDAADGVGGAATLSTAAAPFAASVSTTSAAGSLPTRPSVIQFRWVRLMSMAAQEAEVVAEAVPEAVAAAAGSQADASQGAATSAATAATSTTAPVPAVPESGPRKECKLSWLQRHHAAVAVTDDRVVYVSGGLNAEGTAASPDIFWCRLPAIADQSLRPVPPAESTPHRHVSVAR